MRALHTEPRVRTRPETRACTHAREQGPGNARKDMENRWLCDNHAKRQVAVQPCNKMCRDAATARKIRDADARAQADMRALIGTKRRR
eukprot:3312332-Pleurochrysis_carterae.AAC.1